jgi:hypothetical protein
MPQRHDALLIQALPDTAVRGSADCLFGPKPNNLLSDKSVAISNIAGYSD